MTPASTTQDRIAFVQRMGKALHRYGAPAHRLEDALKAMSNELGLKGNFFTTPSAIMYSYDIPGENGIARLQRVHNNAIDLHRLSQLDKLFNDFIGTDLTVTVANARLDGILDESYGYNQITKLFAFTLTSGGASTFFGGNLGDVALSSICGFLLFLIFQWSQHRDAVRRLFDPLSATVISFVATVGAALLGANADISTLAGIIVLVPGFSIIIGSTELVLDHPVSGSARLARAGMTVLMLFIGVLFGSGIAQHLFDIDSLQQVVPPTMPVWLPPLSIVIAGLGVGVLFNNSRRDLPWAVVAVCLPYLAMKFGLENLERAPSLFLGAVIVALFGNMFARAFDRPALTVLMPGILILVPGATSFLSITDIAGGNFQTGLQSAFQVFISGAAIVAGFMTSSLLLPPRKAL
ncbi:MAG: threonine/serine exporter family protein [Planctomycetota bacterium]|nr:threonine/serine exporter family protein [Planctomycetota bacterium]MDG2309928.1 threonine/serine exporter family protein [Planctomycetota bacterium]